MRRYLEPLKIASVIPRPAIRVLACVRCSSVYYSQNRDDRNRTHCGTFVRAIRLGIESVNGTRCRR
jgi:hypothetical protein